MKREEVSREEIEFQRAIAKRHENMTPIKALDMAEKWRASQEAGMVSVPRDSMAIRELQNIANAKRFDRKLFRDDTEWADWAQSRCRHALSAAPAPAEQDVPTDASQSRDDKYELEWGARDRSGG